MSKTKPEPLIKQEMDALINEAYLDSEFYYALFILAKTTGRRLGEYYDMQVRNIDFTTNVIVTKILKRRKIVEREGILSQEVASILLRYIRKKNLSPEHYIFREVSRRSIQDRVKIYGKRAGIHKNVMFHNFRHYFITELVRLGWSYDKIAKLTGHSDVGSLSIYDHAVASDIKKEALEALKSL